MIENQISILTKENLSLQNNLINSERHVYQIDIPRLDYVKAVILEKNTLFTDQVTRNPPKISTQH